MMSILPKASIALATSSSGAPGLVKSPANTAVSPSISVLACSATSPSRSLMRTCAPCSTSSSAVARPMPRAEPVTIADLPSSTPIALLSLSYFSCGSASYIWLRSRRSATPSASARRSAADGAEVLRVRRAGLAAAERGGHARRDADAGVAVARVEDVGAVPRRGHPARHYGRRRGLLQRAEGNVLADFPAAVDLREVTTGAQAVQRRAAAGAYVFEVVAEHHVGAVRLRGFVQVPVGLHRDLAARGAGAVDQAQHRGAHAVEVQLARNQAGVGAGPVACDRTRAVPAHVSAAAMPPRAVVPARGAVEPAARVAPVRTPVPGSVRAAARMAHAVRRVMSGVVRP